MYKIIKTTKNFKLKTISTRSDNACLFSQPMEAEAGRLPSLHRQCQTTKQDCPKYMIKQNREKRSLATQCQPPSSTFSAQHPFRLPLSLREAPFTLNDFICRHQLQPS